MDIKNIVFMTFQYVKNPKNPKPPKMGGVRGTPWFTQIKHITMGNGRGSEKWGFWGGPKNGVFGGIRKYRFYRFLTYRFYDVINIMLLDDKML